MSSELFQTIEAIGREKGIDTEVILKAVEEAYAAASRKYYRSKEDFGARFDKKSGVFLVFSKRTVVEEEELIDPLTEITLEEAREIDGKLELGDVIENAIETAEAPLTRIAAQAAKQVIYQKVKEAERELIYEEYKDRVNDILTGQVKRFDRGDMIVDLGRTDGIVPRREQSRAEHYNPGDRIRTVVVEVDRQGKGPQLILSRASETLVRKLFEMEVPEIYDGTVSIVNVARDAGERSKVAVRSRDRDVDPVGACVGMKGSRVQSVIRELRGEKIDIVQFNDEATQYVRNALNPAVINRVLILEYEERSMEVIVGEDQLSLAIGKRGQNVRLASKLVGWNLDIMSEAEKKADMEAEMERLAQASAELSTLPGVDEEISTRLLEAGFRTMEEVALASLEELTSIEGIDEDLAVDIHDASETLLEEWQAQQAREEAEAAAAAELAGEEEDSEESEEAEAEEATEPEETVETDASTVDDETGEDEVPEAGGEEISPPAAQETSGAGDDDLPGEDMEQDGDPEDSTGQR